MNDDNLNNLGLTNLNTGTLPISYLSNSVNVSTNNFTYYDRLLDPLNGYRIIVSCSEEETVKELKANILLTEDIINSYNKVLSLVGENLDKVKSTLKTLERDLTVYRISLEGEKLANYKLKRVFTKKRQEEEDKLKKFKQELDKLQSNTKTDLT